MDDFTPLNLFGSDDDPIDSKTEETPAEPTVQEPVIEQEAPAEAQPEPDEVPQESPAETAAPEEKSAANEQLIQVIETQQRLLDGIEELNKLFNARIMRTDHEEKIVDRMHSELQKYKEDMYAQLIRPILMDIIEVRDSIMRISAAFLAKPEGEQNIPNKTFADYAYDLQDILERNSIEIYRSNPGDDFAPLKQRVIKKLATADESLHGKVAESHSCGYSYNGRTISAEKITVYFYEKPVEENMNSEVIENG